MDVSTGSEAVELGDDGAAMAPTFVLTASNDEEAAHQAVLAAIAKEAKKPAVWA
jgi:hypothetical protein